MLNPQRRAELHATFEKICINQADDLNKKQALHLDLILQCTVRNTITLIASDRPQTLRSSFEDELPFIFVEVSTMISALQNMRIVEKIARPIERESKIRLINQVNQTLQKIQLKLNFIKQKSSKFSKSKGEPVKITFERQSILVQDQIYPSRWKDGLRKVQVKLNNFYKERLNKFQKVNDALGQRFVIKKIDVDAWLKNCMKKMKGYCWCG